MSIITNTPVGLPKQGRTTSSYWLQDGANPLAKQGAADNFTHQNVDVVIIGSGITGISAAYHLIQGLKTDKLSRAGKFRIVILEARDFCSGATGRNGGHFITLPYDNFLSRTARSSPNVPPMEGDGVKAARLENSTLDKLHSLITEHDWAADVHLAKNGHTRLFFTPEEEEEDLKEYNAAKEAGVHWDGIYRVTKEEMAKDYGSPYPGVAIPAGSIWPVKLVTKLYQLALAQAADASAILHLHTHIPVKAINPVSTSSSTQSKTGPVHWHIHTSRGVLTSRFVIHATNAWASHLLPQYTRRLEDEDRNGVSPKYGTWIAPLRGQIIATRANVSASILTQRAFASDWMEDYWLPEPVHGTSSSSGNALIILGGGRDSEGDDTELGVWDDTTLNPRLSASLRTILPKAFPQHFDPNIEPEMEWTGIQAVTDIEDPIVGPVPVDPRVPDGKYLPGQYISAGYSGHGMSRAFSCAEAIVGMLFSEMKGETISRPEWLPTSFSTLRQ